MFYNEESALAKQTQRESRGESSHCIICFKYQRLSSVTECGHIYTDLLKKEPHSRNFKCYNSQYDIPILRLYTISLNKYKLESRTIDPNNLS